MRADLFQKEKKKKERPCYCYLYSKTKGTFLVYYYTTETYENVIFCFVFLIIPLSRSPSLHVLHWSGSASLCVVV